MKVIITSFKRSTNVITLQSIPKSEHRRIVLCVYAEEKEVYTRANEGFDILVRPKNVHGLSAARQWLMKEFYPKPVLLLDDDLRIVERDTPSMTYGPLSEEGYRSMISELSTQIAEGSPHASISFKWMNNTKPESVSYCGRASAFHACDTRFVIQNKIRWDRVENLQEPDFILQILKTGHRNAILNEFCHDQKIGTPGGCAVRRTVEILTRCAKQVHAFHPDCTTLSTTRAYKAFSNEPVADLRVQWKKAYQIGLDS